LPPALTLMAWLRLGARTLLSAAVYGVLLFLPAWTLQWWRAWLLLAAVFGAMLATRIWVFEQSGGLLEERRKPPIQRGQPPADKLLVIGFLTVFPAYIAFIPLDVFRFHLLDKPAPIVSAFGLLIAAAGWCVMFFALRENRFAAAIVKHQDERGQVVVETGVYGVVRHPLYFGVALLLVGVALWLQSYAAAIASIVPIALLVVRIAVEEAFLRGRLDGYEAYIERVRYRLIPRVW
jgi:protein-S-isoprenylcysteine O-methyltransferase Ste14